MLLILVCLSRQCVFFEHLFLYFFFLENVIFFFSSLDVLVFRML
jgi:hypothetical protein